MNRFLTMIFALVLGLSGCVKLSTTPPPSYSTRNLLINGAPVMFQRAYTSAQTGAIYTFDRWIAHTEHNGTDKQWAVDQLSGYPPPSGLPYMQLRDFASGAASQLHLMQRIEARNLHGLSGKNVTLSFYIGRSGTNAAFSGDNGRVNVRVYRPANVDTWGSWGTATLVYETTVTDNFSALPDNPSGSWSKYSYTFNVTSAMTYYGAGVMISAQSDNLTGTSYMANAAGFVLGDVMLNVGDVAAPFRLAGEDMAGEQAKAQRYFWQMCAGEDGNALLFRVSGYASAGSQNFYAWYLFPVRMRALPVITVSSSWSLTNCSQPVNSRRSRDGFDIMTTSSAAGTWQFYGIDTDDCMSANAEL